jgi:hypothetical protein
MEEDMFFDIGWHYEYWWGLRPEAAARAWGLLQEPRGGAEPHEALARELGMLSAALIGVEAKVHDLPAFRGQPLILMRPARLTRSCSVGFFAPLHNALRSRTTMLRQLPPAEVDTLCDNLRAEAEKLG